MLPHEFECHITGKRKEYFAEDSPASFVEFKVVEIYFQPTSDMKKITEMELITIKGDRSFSTYGNVNKNDLLQRWMAGLELAKESLYAISGFGDGSHAKFFLKHSSKGTHFIVAEKDPSLLRETLCRFDCSELE